MTKLKTFTASKITHLQNWCFKDWSVWYWTNRLKRKLFQRSMQNSQC